MVDAAPKPQILEHLHKSLTWTVFDTKYVAQSTRWPAKKCQMFGYYRHV